MVSNALGTRAHSLVRPPGGRFGRPRLQGNVARSEGCSREASDIARKELDRNHPDVAAVAGSRAGLLLARVRKFGDPRIEDLARVLCDAT